MKARVKSDARGSNTGMRSEARALLCLSRGEAFAQAHELDWDAFLELARRHQVAGLCHWQLENSACLASGLQVPGAVRTLLRMAYLRNLVRNDHLALDLAELHSALETRGVEALVFKGPWLAFEAYPALGTRNIDDIDLGILERDYEPAVSALESLGYRLHGPRPANGLQALERVQYGQQMRFRARGRRMLELHFRLVNFGPPSSGEPWLWARRQALELPCGTIQVPGPEAMLWHVLLHANQHGYALLRLLYDVRYTLESVGRDLQRGRFLELVQSRSCSASAYHGLLLARELAGAAVEEELLTALDPGSLRDHAFDFLWDVRRVRTLESPRRRTEFEAARLYLLELDGLRQKARYLAGVVRHAGGARSFLRRFRSLRRRSGA